jgi:hypothetical protein
MIIENMLLVPFPATILAPKTERWRIAPRTVGGGETLTGGELAVTVGAGRWLADMNFMVYSPVTNREMRAFVDDMEGRANYTFIGPWDTLNGQGVIDLTGGIPYAPDHALHSDGSGFQQGGVPSVVVLDAATGATQIRVFAGSVNVPIVRGVFVGIGTWLHRIMAAEALPNEEWLLTVRPKLREAAPVGTPVEWEKPVAPMRFVADDVGAYDRQIDNTGSVNLSFVEVW